VPEQLSDTTCDNCGRTEPGCKTGEFMIGISGFRMDHQGATRSSTTTIHRPLGMVSCRACTTCLKKHNKNHVVGSVILALCAAAAFAFLPGDYKVYVGGVLAISALVFLGQAGSTNEVLKQAALGKYFRTNGQGTSTVTDHLGRKITLTTYAAYTREEWDAKK
jgi:hypothetical protein